MSPTLRLTAVCCVCAFAVPALRAAEDAAKAYDQRLSDQRQKAATRNAADSANTQDARDKARAAAKHAQDKADQKKDMAEYKQKTLDNLSSIKELFAKAEDCWKNKSFGDAGALYSSVVLATVPGSEEMAETSRNRLLEMEDLAKAHLKAADDADLKREYVTEVQELNAVTKDFGLTKTYDVALRRLITLKSRPEIAGYVELAQAEAYENDSKVTEAVKLYDAIANNPRYDNTVPWLKAKRKIDELNKNEAVRTKIKEELDAKADKECPNLLQSSKNYASNNQPKQAIEKLQIILDKYGSSKYAEEAKKRMAELK